MPRSGRFIHYGPESCALLIAVLILLSGFSVCAQNAASSPAPLSFLESENWNFHIQNTDTVQDYPAFHAKYSGANSLPSGGQIRQTVAVDLLAGLRLWRGAELHFDGLMWEGFGLHDTLGLTTFPTPRPIRAARPIGD
jgi:hypothetical protein